MSCRGVIEVSAEVASHLLGKPLIKNGTVKSEEAYERILESIQSCFLFAGLDEDEVEDVITTMVEQSVHEGDVIISEGDDGDHFYVVEKGIYQASKGDAVLFNYEHKGAFGELALMYNCPRAATIKALSDGILWAVDRRSFQSLLVGSMASKRQKYEGILGKMHIFRDLSPGSVSVIADCLTRETFQSGTCIIHEGEELQSDAKFYIVEKGTVDCYKTYDGDRKLVKTIKSGGFFGEVALVSKQNRQADCIAHGTVQLLSLGRDAFERLMGPVETILRDRIQEYEAVNEAFTDAV